MTHERHSVTALTKPPKLSQHNDSSWPQMNLRVGLQTGFH